MSSLKPDHPKSRLWPAFVWAAFPPILLIGLGPLRFAHSERRSTPFLRGSTAGNRVDLREIRLRPLLYSRGKHDPRLAVVFRDGSPRLYL